MTARCARCKDMKQDCQAFGLPGNTQKVTLCHDCATKIVIEWNINQNEIKKTATS